jgi:coenzyme F420 biosynthesis associated uncharacterized protein
VDWGTAERVAGWVVRRQSMPAGYRPDALQTQFDELTREAEGLVVAATGLEPAGPARARVTDRLGWVRANVGSMQRLLAPTLERYEARRKQSPFAPFLAALPPQLSGFGRTASGAEVGALLGWMSQRVLGQYDLLLTDEFPEDQDLVYYVGPNVVAMEQRYGFAEREFRLWLALHEVTHRCQFTAVPWLRDHFVSLVDSGLEPFASDPSHMADSLKRAAGEWRAGRSPLDDAGVLGLIATPAQREALQRIQALMSLLEGHGDVTMDRAGAAAVPGAERFARVLHDRRQSVRGPTKVLQQILGIEAKMRQYAEGEKFVHAVEVAGGPELFNSVWRGPEWLPSLAEIRDPAVWLSRVGASPALG